MTGSRSPWPLVGLLYLTGLLAAAQLGKLSALAPLVAADLRLSLPTMASAISLLELGGATLGAVAGLLAHRLGLRRSLRWGLACLALGGLGGALAQGEVGLLGWRLLEAAGYLGVIVSAPVLIAHHTADHAADRTADHTDHRAADRSTAQTAAIADAHADAPGRITRARTQGLALTLWSTFVPVGLALGAWASAELADRLGWRGAVLAGGAVAALLWSGVWRARLPAAAEASAAALPPLSGVAPGLVAGEAPLRAAGLVADPAPSAPSGSSAISAASATPATPATPRLGPAAWCLALAFGGFALFQVGLLALLPTWLVQQAGLSAAAAGQWTGLAALSAVAGSASAAALLHHGRALRGPVMLSLGLPALLLWGVFASAPAAGPAITLVVVINLLGGVFASLVFALLPVVAGSSGQMVRANGLLAQCGASGSLLGPPLMAAAVQAGGWPAAALLGGGVTLLALPLAWRALAPAQPAGRSAADGGHSQAGHPLR